MRRITKVINFATMATITVGFVSRLSLCLLKTDLVVYGAVEKKAWCGPLFPMPTDAPFSRCLCLQLHAIGMEVIAVARPTTTSIARSVNAGTAPTKLRQTNAQIRLRELVRNPNGKATRTAMTRTTMPDAVGTEEIAAAQVTTMATVRNAFVGIALTRPKGMVAWMLFKRDAGPPISKAMDFVTMLITWLDAHGTEAIAVAPSATSNTVSNASALTARLKETAA